MLMPKKTKFRKVHKGRNRGKPSAGTRIGFGEFALKSTGYRRISSKQIEAARQAMTRHVKRGAKIWIRLFPDKPITQKPLEVRMGKGKGAVEYWVSEVRPGTILFEMQGASEALARESFALGAAKLPVGVSFVKRRLM